MQHPQRGVLLYYAYVSLRNGTQAEVAEWYRQRCEAAGLRGRIRVAEDGVNVTLGGSWEGLQQHIEAVREYPVLKNHEIDFKLATTESTFDAQGIVTHETGFDGLSVRECKELVTLGPLAQGRADALHNGGQHLSPQQFHHMLQQATTNTVPSSPKMGVSNLPPPASNAAAGTAGVADASGVGSIAVAKEVVLIDARNVYETNVGHFDVDGVELLDPQTRCFSELPAWLDRMEGRLKGRRILMYCTGGVRCERASAYLKEKGKGFEDVYQLKGGIQRYLEEFSADGGFFKGKNFVYDDRISVGPPYTPPAAGEAAADEAAPCERTQSGSLAHGGQQAATASQQEGQATTAAGLSDHLPTSCPSAPAQQLRTSSGRASPAGSWGTACSSTPGSALVVGRCVACEQPWDDYRNRARCSRCRMLILLCDACQCRRQLQGQQQQQGQLQAGGQRGDQQHQGQQGRQQQQGNGETGSEDPGQRRRLPLSEQRIEGIAETEQQRIAGCQPLLCVICMARGHKGRSHTRKGRKQAASSAHQAAGAEDQERRQGGVPAPAIGSQGSGKQSGGSIRLPGGGCAAILASPPASTGGHDSCSRRLRILCLHGFRQTGYKLLGRTCGVRKHLDDLADFFFPDAPHLLPHFFKRLTGTDASAADSIGQPGGPSTRTPGHMAPGLASTAAHQPAACANAAPEATHLGPAGDDSQRLTIAPAAHKRAWLISPELVGSCADQGNATESEHGVGQVWQEAPAFVDEHQYLGQTEGWSESWRCLETFIRQHGPFDGVLGFSQGSAVAAVLCALQQQQQRQQHQQEREHNHRQEGCRPGAHGSDSVQLGFRFAILASGYRSRCPEHEQLLASVAPIRIPSLHVFGGLPSTSSLPDSLASRMQTLSSGSTPAAATSQAASNGTAPAPVAPSEEDRQVSALESERLAALFAAEAGRRYARHGQGHVLPCKRAVVQELRSFLLEHM